jgi:predicted RNase H-like nuclease
VDDVLDAAAGAWTAQRVAGGSAQRRPDPPEILGDGSACAIWT